jgi:hypothetical protein
MIRFREQSACPAANRKTNPGKAPELPRRICVMAQEMRGRSQRFAQIVRLGPSTGLKRAGTSDAQNELGVPV